MNRSEPYRRHIASQPCEVCGHPETQAAHQTIGQYRRGKKPPDSRCMSLCFDTYNHRGCHEAFDHGTQQDKTLILARVLDNLLDERAREWERMNG